MRKVLGIGLALLSCSVYDESLLEEKSSFDPQSCRWGDCWWSEARDGCESADQPGSDERPPEAPPEEQEIAFALSTIWLGESLPPEAEAGAEPWQAFGFDLDGVCTNPAGCAVSLPDIVSCSSPAGAHADGVGCRDNAFAQIFPAAAATELGSTYGISEDKLNCGLHRGSYNLLVRVTGYGGGLDDSNVRVEVQSSPGLEEPLPYECDVPGWQDQLSWDGPASPDYPWKVDFGSLNTVSDPAAYVKNGYLVAHFPDGAELVLPGENSVYSGLSLKLSKGVLAARLELDNGKIWGLLDGVIAGRMRRDDLVASLRRTGFCDTTAAASYTQVLSSIDGALDVLANGATDAFAPCDGLSVGIAFRARQAKIGAAATVVPPVECVGN